MPLETEQRLGGRYRLEEPIGYGGMGRVFRAHDELLDRAVAVKLVEQPTLGASEIAEARAAARLSHPGVVHIFDVGVSDATQQPAGYIVMELVPGRSLREILNEQGKLPVSKAADLALQLADSLEAIHQLGTIHCDVKPLNVIVTPLGHTKLVDFGIARAASETGDSVGSAAYVAPEQARGEPVDPRTDVYALGAVLYEMLVGRRAFSGESTTELLRQKLVADPPRPRALEPHVPRDLDAIVMRAMAREPADRYASAGDMANELRAMLARAAEPTQVIEPPRVRRPARTAVVPAMSRIERRGIALAAAVVICLLAVVGWRVTHPPANGVPTLVGLQLSDVPTALEQAGIAPADVTVLTRPVPSQYVGKVVDQQPQPGLPRKGDARVQIAIGVRQ